MSDQIYFDAGYLDDDYFGIIAEAEIALSGALTASIEVKLASTSSYYTEDYMVADYFVAGVTHEGAVALTVTATSSSTIGLLQTAGSSLTSATTQATTVVKTVNAVVAIDSLFSPSITVSATRTSDITLTTNFTMASDGAYTRGGSVTLDNIINLSAQSDRTRNTASTLVTTASLSILFTTNLPATQLTSASALTAIPISYTLRTGPRALVANTDTITYNTNSLKFGSYRANAGGNTRKIQYVNQPTLAPDNTDEWAFDAWINDNSTVSLTNLLTIDDNGNTASTGYSIQLNQNSHKLTVKIYDSSGNSSASISTTDVLGYRTWHHVAVIWKPGTGVKVFVDGTKTNEITTSANIRTFTTPRITLGDPSWEASSNTLFSLDEVRFGKGVTGYTYSNNTFTVETTPYTNTQYTTLLLHLENNTVDDITNWSPPRVTHEVASALSSSFTVSADDSAILATTVLQVGASTLSVNPNYIANHGASISSSTTIETVAGIVHPGAASFDSIISNINVISKIGDTLIACDVTSTLTAAVNETIQLGAGLSSATALSVTANVIADASIALSTNVTVLTDAQGGFIGIVAPLSSAFTQGFDYTRIRPGQSALSSNTTQDVSAAVTTDAVSTMPAAFTQDFDHTRIRPFSTAFESIATELVAAVKVGDIVVDISTNATLTINARVTTGTVIPFDSAFTVVAPIAALKTSDVSLSSTTTLEAAVLAGKVANAVLDTTSSVAIGVNATIDITGALSGAMSFSTTVRANLAGEIDLVTAVTQVANVKRVRETSVALVSTSSTLFTVSKLISGESALSSTATMVTAGRKIPTEYRSGSISSETRTHTITYENRSQTFRS
jgi:hypothetical protein